MNQAVRLVAMTLLAGLILAGMDSLHARGLTPPSEGKDATGLVFDFRQAR